MTNEATCIGCGCTDMRACEGLFGEGCYWLVIDRKTRTGVCSACPKELTRWRKGDRTVQRRKAHAHG